MGSQRQAINEALGGIRSDGGKYLYNVQLSWHDDRTDSEVRANQNYVFTEAESALAFARNLAYSHQGEQYGNPKQVYLFPVEVRMVTTRGGIVPAMVVDDESRFLARWDRADECLKSDGLM